MKGTGRMEGRIQEDEGRREGEGGKNEERNDTKSGGKGKGIIG